MTTIGAAARQTGICASTLRKWESRYRFPVPVRGATGHQQFSQGDLETLARETTEDRKND
jgi:DNA-binding transcriptional MerR regulator